MLAYAVAALTLSRGSAPAGRSRAALRLAAGGLVVGAAWLLILAPADVAKSLVFVPLAVALLASGRRRGTSRDSRHERRARAAAAALWSGLVGGLLVFIV